MRRDRNIQEVYRLLCNVNHRGRVCEVFKLNVLVIEVFINFGRYILNINRNGFIQSSC